MKLVLEGNDQIVKDNGILYGGKIMITPTINKDYWVLRVKLSEKQAIVAFPKFLQIGIGFQEEKDWNSNLPSSCDTERIYEHIKGNKGDSRIKKDDCIKAIKMIQKYAEKYNLIKQLYPNRN